MRLKLDGPLGGLLDPIGVLLGVLLGVPGARLKILGHCWVSRTRGPDRGALGTLLGAPWGKGNLESIAGTNKSVAG